MPYRPIPMTYGAPVETAEVCIDCLEHVWQVELFFLADEGPQLIGLWMTCDCPDPEDGSTEG